MQVNAGNPPPAPTPAAPANNNKLGDIVGSIEGLHKDVFGFQALDASQDTSGAVLQVTAETGVAGTDITAAGPRTASSFPMLPHTVCPVINFASCSGRAL